jgi:hypothetical protein
LHIFLLVHFATVFSSKEETIVKIDCLQNSVGLKIANTVQRIL